MTDLEQLFGAYFHQDWFVEYDGSWEAGVDEFARDEPDRISGAIAEIDSMLERITSDDELGRAIDELGNYRHPGTAPDAHKTWLVGIRTRLSTHQ